MIGALGVLGRVMPERGVVLEIASGAGVHVAHFAQRLPQLTFQPTEASDGARAEIDARVLEAGVTNVLPALALDVLRSPWPVTRADALVCINMIHASVPQTLPALMQHAGLLLPKGAPLVTYGPYRIDGKQTSSSNVEFDAWLKRERHPSWGIRDLEAVVAAAAENGLALEERITMPANNFTLVFRRS